MQTIIKVIKNEDYDRYIFLSMDNEKIVGINFHQGIAQVNGKEVLDWSFATIDSHVTEIFFRLQINYPNISNKLFLVNKAIELFCDAFIHQDIETNVMA